MNKSEQDLRDELAVLRQRYELKVQHFNAIHSIAKHMKTDIRELARRVDDLEKKINRKK